MSSRRLNGPQTKVLQAFVTFYIHVQGAVIPFYGRARLKSLRKCPLSGRSGHYMLRKKSAWAYRSFAAASMSPVGTADDFQG
jgi:hypothetical protein